MLLSPATLESVELYIMAIAECEGEVSQKEESG